MGIFRSNDPTTFDDVDGIIIDESAPAPSVQGVGTNVAILVGQFERGPSTLEEPGSTANLFEQYGKLTTSGMKQLKNKRFGRLKLIRVTAAAAVNATIKFQESATDRITFTAKYSGAYGNNITVEVFAATTAGRKYVVTDTNPGSVLPAETYDDIAIASITAATFAESKLIDVSVDSALAEPDIIAATNLLTGSDGTIADTDYETALVEAETEGAGNFLFLDEYNAIRSGYLKVHAAATQDKMVIHAGPEVQTRASVVTDVANYRDTEGRGIYAYPWVQTTIDGANEFVNPAGFYASVLSQTSPTIDPAFTGNSGFLAGITKLKLSLSRADYIALKDAGVSAFELDPDVGFKIKSGIVTQILNSSKVTVLRRRMADFLTNSGGRFLKNFQNAVNSLENRRDAGAQLLSFVETLERDKILPKDAEVQTGKAKLIDSEVLNSDATIGQGFFKLLWRQRIFSSMRFIVLQVEVGETVVVTEE